VASCIGARTIGRLDWGDGGFDLFGGEEGVAEEEEEAENPDEGLISRWRPVPSLMRVKESRPRLRPVAMVKVSGVATRVRNAGKASLKSSHRTRATAIHARSFGVFKRFRRNGKAFFGMRGVPQIQRESAATMGTGAAIPGVRIGTLTDAPSLTNKVSAIFRSSPE